MKAGFLAPLLVFAVMAAPGGLVSSGSADSFPDVIPLPLGWQPEGIVVGDGHTIYSGSRLNGGIYAADLRTGEGSILVPSQEANGRVAIGLSYDSRSGYLFVAGGPGGAAYVYDTETGEDVAQFTMPVCQEGTFVNDVVVTRRAAYLTDSACPLIYRIPLGAGGSLPDPGEVEAVELTGDYTHESGFNANGIAATPDGKRLIIVQSNTGRLYNVDPETGVATLIEVSADDEDDELVTFGDGILLDGKTLYVVRNQLNLVTRIDLAPDLLGGEFVSAVTSENFRIPTTIAAFGSRLYVVNARFGESDPMAEYEIVRVPSE